MIGILVRRGGLGVAILASIFLASSLGGAAGAAPGGPNCKVENRTTGAKSKDLVLAIQEATAGGVLQIQGVCAGAFVVNKELTLRGKGTKEMPVATITGSTPTGTMRTLEIRQDGVVTVENLNIAAGSALGSGGCNGGCDGAGGNIVNEGFLTVRNSTISGGTATAGGNIANVPGATLIVEASRISDGQAVVEGGGIDNDGDATLSGVTIERNRTDLGGGGRGGGVYAGGVVGFHGVDIRNNHADSGGGIYVPSFLLAAAMTVTGNVAHGLDGPLGGGMCFEPGALVDIPGLRPGIFGNTPDDICSIWHLTWLPLTHDFGASDGSQTFRLTNTGSQPITFSAHSVAGETSPAGGVLTFDETRADACFAAHNESGTPLPVGDSCLVDASFTQNPIAPCGATRDATAFVEFVYFTNAAKTTTAAARATATAKFTPEDVC